MTPMLNIAIKAARKAGDLIARNADRIDQLSIEEKDKNDFVSDVDKNAEAIILETLQEAFPEHAYLGEETGEHKADTDNEYQWIIDPLDGTTNFLFGIPHFAVSIALLHKNKIDQAVIYDPIKNDLFTASRGRGAFLNNRRIRVSKRPSLYGALLTTGVPYRPDQADIVDKYFNTMKTLLPDTSGVRRPGSAALDLAYVAAGRYDGFWEFGLHQWDIAAGILLVQEAGGLVGDLHGNNQFMESGDIVAANPKVFKAMIQRLHKIL